MRKDLDDWLKGEVRQEPLLVAPIAVAPRPKSEGLLVVPLLSSSFVETPASTSDTEVRDTEALEAEAEENAETSSVYEAELNVAENVLEFESESFSAAGREFSESESQAEPPAVSDEGLEDNLSAVTPADKEVYNDEIDDEGETGEGTYASAEGDADDGNYNDDETSRPQESFTPFGRFEREALDVAERLRRIAQMKRPAQPYYKRAASRSLLGRIFTVCVVLILVAGTVFAVYRHMRNNSYENLMENARLLYESEQYAPALDAYKAAFERHPERVEPILGAAHSAERLGRVEEAIGAYQASLDHFSIDAVLHRSQIFYEMGRLYTSLKAWDKARESFEITLAIDSANYSASFALGNVLEEQGSLPPALEAYRRAQELSPSSDAAREAIRRVSSLLPPKEPDLAAQAKQKYDHALQVGAVALELKRYGEASDYFADALAISSGDAGVWVSFAEARANLGDSAGAIKSLERALERDPNHGGAKTKLDELNAQKAEEAKTEQAPARRNTRSRRR